MFWNAAHLCVGTPPLLLAIVPSLAQESEESLSLTSSPDVTPASGQSAVPGVPLLVEQFVFDFQEGNQGWEVGYADYPVGEEKFHELQSAHRFLPRPLDSDQGALAVSGNNHSDDLFMFIKRKLRGLRPNREYRMWFDVQLASQYPANALGVGGAPGSGVILKAGATAVEPDKIVDHSTGFPFYVMNIDKGNQSVGGDDMTVIGHVGIPGDEFVWTLIDRQNGPQPFIARTDDEGALWICVGTDSAFESTTLLYYDTISVTLY